MLTSNTENKDSQNATNTDKVFSVNLEAALEASGYLEGDLLTPLAIDWVQ